MNGLIRQYLPKGTDFANVTPEDIQKIEDKLNNSPRKRLDYMTQRSILYTSSTYCCVDRLNSPFRTKQEPQQASPLIMRDCPVGIGTRET